MTKPKGGRGYKAPYETVVIRVPKPLESLIEQQIDDYRSVVLEGKELNHQEEQISLDSAILQAKEILKQKKGARDSMEKLLQVIYGVKTSLKE